MISVAEVRTGARLHFGLLSTGHQGRLGGIGMMIDRPGFFLRARLSRSGQDTFRGSEVSAKKAANFVASLRNGIASLDKTFFDFEIIEEIPSHRGFGSGTQLALAVAAAVQRLNTFYPYIPISPLGRSGRSAVGGSGFFRGGFVYDPGPRNTRSLAGVFDEDFHFPGVLHRKVPEGWRLVVIDPSGGAGHHGTQEANAFAQLPPMSQAVGDRLHSLVADEIIPALEQADFVRFASGVAEFNRTVGNHFAPVQGGVYAHSLIRDLARTLAYTRWPYLAQSSWGPAAAVFCESVESARELVLFLAGQMSRDDANVFIASPRNTRAEAIVYGQ